MDKMRFTLENIQNTLYYCEHMLKRGKSWKNLVEDWSYTVNGKTGIVESVDMIITTEPYTITMNTTSGMIEGSYTEHDYVSYAKQDLSSDTIQKILGSVFEKGVDA